MPRRLSAQQSHIPVIAVAGGAGFLGSHICESLLQSGVQVLALDNLVTGSMRNLAGIKHHPHFEFIECNINQGVPESLHDRRITHVIQAAGVETHGESKEATLAMTLTGAFGTKNMLDLAVASGARFLLVSSINVYEGLASATQLENYFGSNSAQEARFSQQEAKRYAEGLCQLYAKEYNLDARIARLSQLYGPRMDVRTPELISRLIRATVDGKNLEVAADGNATLLLTYVTDAVYGISRLLFAEDQLFKGSIYAFANPEKVSVLSVAYTLRDLAGVGREVTFLPTERQPEFALPKISVERVKKDLDWEPTVSVTDGLRQTIAAFKEQAPPVDDHVVTLQHLQTLPVEANKAGGDVADSSAEVLLPKKSKTVDDQSGGLRFRGGMGAATERLEPTPTSATATAIQSSAAKAKTTARKAKAVVASKKGDLKRKGWWRRLLFGSLAILLYLALGRPVSHTVAYATAGVMGARSGMDQATSLHFAKAGSTFTQSGAWLQSAEQSVGGVSWFAGMVGQKGELQQLQRGLLGLGQSLEAVAALCRVADPVMTEIQQLAHFDRPSSDGHFSMVMSRAQDQVGQAKAQLSRAQVLLGQPTSAKVAGASFKDERDASSSWLDGLLGQARLMVSQAQSGLDVAEEMLTVAPKALGADSAKTYLVMLENSNELRPTGGFLGSYAYVKLEHGRIVDFAIDDIYNPSNKLQSTVAAPAAFNKAFTIRTLQLIDANWSPDAAVSGAQVADLYSQATGHEVDGVVFMTTGAVKLVLEAVGPMKMKGYEETVTADNFDQLAQVHSDVGFTPGSTGKKDFLGEMADTLLTKFKQQKSDGLVSVAKAVGLGLQTKEIQLWAADAPVQAVLGTQNWTGEMTKTQDDYLRVVDANMSANKANYYVRRSTEYDINVDRDSNLHSVVTVQWEHSGTSATWPGGDYRNYVRIYAPQGSTLTGWNGFDEDGVTQSEEGGKAVFGGFVVVPYNTTRSVEVRYDLPTSISLPKNDGAYTLVWQKQAGIIDEPVTVRFNAPIFLQAAEVSSGGQIWNDGRVVWGVSGRNDMTLKTRLDRKNGQWDTASP